MLLEDAKDAILHRAFTPKIVRRDLADGVPKAKELRFTLRWRSAAPAIHLVHRDATDRAPDYLPSGATIVNSNIIRSAS
jgi:hypothetical protein